MEGNWRREKMKAYEEKCVWHYVQLFYDSICVQLFSKTMNQWFTVANSLFAEFFLKADVTHHFLNARIRIPLDTLVTCQRLFCILTQTIQTGCDVTGRLTITAKNAWLLQSKSLWKFSTFFGLHDAVAARCCVRKCPLRLRNLRLLGYQQRP